MGQYDGMDVAAVQSAAAHLRGYAGTLDGIIRTIDSIVVQLDGAWTGHDAAAFLNWWQHQHRPALLTAASALDGLGQSAMNNADDQARTSSADAGGSAGSMAVGASAMAGIAGLAGTVFDGADGLDGVLDGVNIFTRNASSSGRYTKEWDDVRNAFGPVFDYKQSSVLHAAHDNRVLSSIGDFADTGVGKAAGGVFSAAAFIGIGSSVARAGGDLADGSYGQAAMQSSSAVSSGLKMSKNPVLYLAGVNTAIWSQVANEASQVDWSQGVPNPLSGSNFVDIWAPAFGDATKQVLSEIPGFFL
jgi:WXG100 family type VII secretion target